MFKEADEQATNRSESRASMPQSKYVPGAFTGLLGPHEDPESASVGVPRKAEHRACSRQELPAESAGKSLRDR